MPLSSGHGLAVSRFLAPSFWAAAFAAAALGGCRAPSPANPPGANSPAASSDFTSEDEAFLEDVQERTFRFFWDLAEPGTGLTPDRYPTRSFASISATGFGLTAYPIGAEHGWVTREEARDRALETLRFLWTAPQDSSPAGAAGHRGFFYHFLDPKTGARFQDVELSTVDTALFLAGALFCQSYFDRNEEKERELRALVDSLTARVDWNWAQVRPPAIGHGWTPEHGHLEWDWRGYNEAMIVYIVALGSPTHAGDEKSWEAWTSSYRWGTFHGEEHLGFAPLFGHQYTHVWIDFRGIQDAPMRERGLDYFENSRRAVRSQRAYAIENPAGWAGYGADLWGLTACDGPVEGRFDVMGKPREFYTYWARGASFDDVRDDGTICPSAAGGSIAFEPLLAARALRFMAKTYGEHLYSKYGFLDAFNPTFTLDVPVQHGRVVPEQGWFDTDYLGIDQGPILAMIENQRTGLVWRTMRKNPQVVRGLKRAGFTGGWLDGEGTGP
jgi:hypothetical protein